MNTISARARRLLRPIALKLVGTWRGGRIDVTKADREAPSASPPRLVGGTLGLPPGGSERGAETAAGAAGGKVLGASRVAACGLSEALSATDSVADRAPWVVGWNCTCTEQEVFGCRVLPLQPSAALAKSPASVPPTATLPIESAAVPTLATVIVPGGAVLPAWALRDTRGSGLRNAGAGGRLVPVPWRAGAVG